MSTILILAQPVPYVRLHDWAIGAGFPCTRDIPLNRLCRTATFTGARGDLFWLARAGSVHALVLAQGNDADPGAEEALAAQVQAAFPTLTLAELVGRLDRAASPAERVYAVNDLGAFVFLRACPEQDQVLDALGRALFDDHPAIRNAAARVLGDVVSRRVEGLYAAAAERHPELALLRDLTREACEADEAGTLHDGPTESWWELEQRAQAGVEKGQWKRVVKAADDLLAQDADHVKGLYYRGLAYEAAGEIPLALAYLGASGAELALELSVHDKNREEGAEDEKAAERALLATVQEKIEALRARGVEPARWEAAREPVLDRLASWWTEVSTATVGAAKALYGLDAGLEAPLAFVWGSYQGDRDKLERALELAPGSVPVELALARAVSEADPAQARTRYESILARLRAGGTAGGGAAAEQVARFDKTPATLAGVLESLASAAFKAGDRVRAMELADELVKVNPDSVQGFQLRGHARLFELRYAEAAEAYAEGIREIDRIYAEGEENGTMFFGNDPRPAMHFNRACAFGRLGMKAEALDALRSAVRGDDKYAEEARTEEWIDCLWGSPELEAIARKDPRALATAEELSPAFLDRLITRCSGLFYRGETDEAVEAGERAVELAGFSGDRRLETRALSALGYALAFSGQAGRAVELLARASTLAEDAPASERAEVAHTQGNVLHAHGDLAGAERAYRRALSLREEAHGEAHPLLAKSYGDLARLEADQGKPGAEVRATIERGVAVLSRFLETHPELDDEWAEAITDRGTLEANVAQSLVREGDLAASLTALETSTATFEAATAGAVLPPRVIESSAKLAEHLAGKGGPLAGRARALVGRLEALLYPGSPAERRERRFVASLRGFVNRARNAGAEDEAIGRTLGLALRGIDSLPPELRDVPELASLAGEMADRAARWTTFLVTGTLAVEMTASDLDGGLDHLEKLCVAHALEAEAEG